MNKGVNLRVVAVIPCYNEEQFVGSAVKAASPFCSMIVVSDDNSTDQTVSEAVRAGASVRLNNENNRKSNNRKGNNRGAGACTQRGIDYALQKGNGADIIVTLDGDGQHDPADIPGLIRPILDGVADVVIGSRFMFPGYRAPKIRKMGIDIITSGYNIGRSKAQKITDGQCCFRAYRREVLERVKIDESGFEFSVEMIIKARSQGWRIVEVPVKCIYHEDFKLNSSMNPIKQGVRVLWGVMRWRWKMEIEDKIVYRLFKRKFNKLVDKLIKRRATGELE